MPIKDFITTGKNRIVLGGAGVALAVAAVGISFFRPAYQVENSDGENLWHVTTGGAIGVGTGSQATVYGTANDCLKSGGGSGKLMSWGTCGSGGASFNSGQVLTIGDGRYVNTSGDSMTGALTIQNGNTPTSTVNALLSVRGVMSGTTLKLLSGAHITLKHAAHKGIIMQAASSHTANLIDIRNSVGDVIFNVSPTGGIGARRSSFNTSYALTTNGNILMAQDAANDLYGFLGKSGDWFGNGDQNFMFSSYRPSFYLSTNNQTVAYLSVNANGLVGINTDTATPAAQLQVNTFNTTTKGLVVRASAGQSATLTEWQNSAGTALSVVDASGNLALGASAASEKLEVIGTASGQTLYGQQIRSSGGIVLEGTLSGSSLYGFGLNTDCDDGTNSKLLWDTTNGRFSCGTDQGGAGAGLSFATAEGIYVNQKGDTMTGTLVINLSSGSQGLNVVQTASGAHIHAEKGLSSSGALTVEGAISGSLLTLNSGSANDSYITGDLAIGKTSARTSTKLDVAGHISGATLRINGDVNVESNTFFIEASSNEVGIGTVNPLSQFHVSGASAGIRLERTGGLEPFILLYDGNLSLGGQIRGLITGAGFRFTDGSTAVEWMRVGSNIGLHTNAAGAKLSVSGATVISDRGNVVASRAAKATLDVVGTISGSSLVISGNAAITGALLVKGNAAVRGALSGYTLTASGLRNCDTIDTDQNGVFSCGTDDGGGSGLAFSTAENIYVNQAGDTMTGALVINVTGGSSTTVGLEVIHTASGSHLHANNTLSSSGTIAVRANDPAGDVAEAITVSRHDGTQALNIWTQDSSNNFAINNPGGTNGILMDAGDTSSSLNFYDPAAAISISLATTTANRSIGLFGPGLKTALSVIGNSNYHQTTVLARPKQGQYIFGVGTGSTAFTSTNAYFVVGSGGLVGIKTPNPKTTLDVVGTISGSALVINGTSALNGKVTFRTNPVTAAPLRITSGATVTSLTEGDLWNDRAKKSLMTYTNAIKQALVGVIYTTTTGATVTNTTTTGSILGTGTGTSTLPANFFVPGKTLRVTVKGKFSTAGSPGTLKFSIKLGNTVVGISPTLVPSATATNRNFTYTVDIQCRTAGTSGLIFAKGDVVAEGSVVTNLNYFPIGGISAVTVDTTSSLAVVPQVWWSSNQAANSITGDIATIEVLN